MSKTETLRFLYRKPDRSLSERLLTAWKEEGHYLTGHDSHSGSVKTFRKDRIERYMDDAESALQTPFSPPPPRVHRDKARDERPQILFTGFPSVQRAALEQRCEAGGLHVVKTVTQGLVFLCAGPNAGPSKMVKAREQHVYVLKEPELHALLETGELPDYAIDEVM